MGTLNMKVKVYLLLFVSLTPSSVEGDVCGPTTGGDDLSKWSTVSNTIIDTPLSAIPEVGPYLAAADTILSSMFSQSPQYTEDLSSCIKDLIKQEIEEDKINMTKKFLEDWQPVLAEWKTAPVASNTSDTKANLAGRLYAMAASGPLTYLPEVSKQETVLSFWFDMATTIVLAYEGTAASFYNDSRYGNSSEDSCQATMNARKFTTALKTIIADNTEDNLNSSFYQRTEKYDITWNCEKTSCYSGDNSAFFNYWLVDTYRQPNNNPIAYCPAGHCCPHQDPGCKECSAFWPWDCSCRHDYFGQCDKPVEDYIVEVVKNVTSVKNFVNKTVSWMDMMIDANNKHIQNWCKNY